MTGDDDLISRRVLFDGLYELDDVLESLEDLAFDFLLYTGGTPGGACSKLAGTTAGGEGETSHRSSGRMQSVGAKPMKYSPFSSQSDFRCRVGPEARKCCFKGLNEDMP